MTIRQDDQFAGVLMATPTFESAPAAPSATPAHTRGTDAREQPVGDPSVLRRAIGHLLLIVLSFLCVFPIYWMYATSLRAPGDVYSTSPLPWPLSLDHYLEVWHKIPIGQMLLNTFVTATTVALGQLLTSLLAAYALAAW